MNRKLSFFSLFILIFATVCTMRNMPSAALLGSPLIFFFILSAILFFIPTALVSAELAAAFPDQGGIYQWVARAFGPRWGMFAVWLQWTNTMVWYPAMLSFIAGALAYLIDPQLIENKAYLLSSILVIFWGMTWVNLRGIHVLAKFMTISTWVGTLGPMVFLIFFGIVWFAGGWPMQISLHPRDMFPSFSQFGSWSALVAVMSAFVGIELSGVHLDEIDQPKKNFPKAVLLATLAIVFAMSFGSLSIAMVLPAEEIDLIAGVIQVFSSVLNLLGLGMWTPWLALAIAVGSIGSMVNWLMGPTKGLLHAAKAGFLPPFFTRQNDHGAAASILLVQAGLVSLFSFVCLFQSSAHEFFCFLTALNVELYMIMYVIMFCAALKLRDRRPKGAIPGFKIAKGWIWPLSSFGIFSSAITTIISFWPPQSIALSHPLRYILLICAGNVLLIGPVFLLFAYRKRPSFLRAALVKEKLGP